MKSSSRLILSIILTSALALVTHFSASGQFFYGTVQQYGKNRVQFNDFDWVFYRFDRFDVYFYRGNDELASQIARMVNKELPYIEGYLDSPLDERLQILVFNGLTDLKQSNVNSSSEDDYNRSGITRISGRRLFVAFTGDYNETRKHLRSGLSEVVLSNMIYGDFGQSITNSALLNLPVWYTEGLISFLGDRWNPKVDLEVENGFLTKKYKRINALMQEDARYAGHSFWNYVAETYGDKVIRNIIYMSVVNRDIESGFLYILGKSLSEMDAGWKNFYQEYYDLDEVHDFYQNEKEYLKTRNGSEIVRMEISPDGRYLAYVEQRLSRYKIYVQDLRSDKRTKVEIGGYRIAQNADYSYPIMSWHPNSEILAYFTEEKGLNKLNFYNLKEKELQKKDFYRFDKVLSFSYSGDGKQFVLSATKQGKSDIFVYTILNTKITQITNDDFDDLEPAFFDNDKRIAWSSNRKLDSLYPKEKLLKIPYRENDIFATTTKALNEDSVKIWRLTNTPKINEIGLQEYDKGFLTYFSNFSGKQKQHIIQIDSSIAYVDTITHYDYNFTEFVAADEPLNVIDQAFSKERDRRYDLVLYKNKYRIYERPFQSPQDLNLRRIQENGNQNVEGTNSKDEPNTAVVQIAETENLPLYHPGIARDEMEVDITNYQFEEGKSKRERTKPKEEPKQIVLLPKPEDVKPEVAEEPVDEEEEFEIPPKRNYFLSLYQDDFSVGFDNMFSNLQYQQFTGVIDGNLLNQGFNMNLKAGVMDLMHDYRLIGGMNFTFQPLPGTSLLPNAEYLVALGDYKKKVDKIYSFRRRSQVNFLAVNNYQRLITNEVEAKGIYPINPVSSIHGSLGYRLDEDISLARDIATLDEPIAYTDYAIARLAFIYDNSRKIGLNLYSGLRFKAFGEYYRNLTKRNSGLYTLGFDARYYVNIHRNMVWANRLAYGASFGQERLIYIMGGVDNDFAPNNDPSTPIAEENNYVFQTLVTNMRGFYQNVRNGNNFMVINSELRWPIVSYIANRPLRNDFLNNLMLIGFADVGSAWNGITPYSDENAINTRVVPLGTGGEIILDSKKDPMVFGSGFGLRSRVFGYYVRADLAWGVEDGVVLPSLFYLSLGTDF